MTVVRLPSRSKYSARRSGEFDSQAEARRAGDLQLLQRAGEISGLQIHPRFTLLAAAPELGFPRPLVYEADFSYFDGPTAEARYVVEDVKGVRTAVYKIKKRLLEQLHGIRVTEVQ